MVKTILIFIVGFYGIPIPEQMMGKLQSNFRRYLERKLKE